MVSDSDPNGDPSEPTDGEGGADEGEESEEGENDPAIDPADDGNSGLRSFDWVEGDNDEDGAEETSSITPTELEADESEEPCLLFFYVAIFSLKL